MFTVKWGDVSSVWTVHVVYFRARSFDDLWAVILILVRPSYISSVICHTKCLNYHDVLKPCNTNR